jgi:hypothetical protein
MALHLKRAQLHSWPARADEQPIDALVATEGSYLSAQGNVQTWKSFFGLTRDALAHHQRAVLANCAVGANQEKVCGRVSRPHITSLKLGHEITS